MRYALRVLAPLLIIFCTSCGVRPAGDVRLTLRSGTSMDVRLLAVDSDAAIIRPSDTLFSDRLRSLPLDSIACVTRMGDVNGAAVWGGGVLGAFGGFGLFALLVPLMETTQQQGDVRTTGPNEELAFGVVMPILIMGGSALGIWAGTHIHKSDKVFVENDPDLREHLRSLALFPNGLPTHTFDSMHGEKKR
ncbi:MAG TPA: hypothetical protein VFD13_00915 [Candidatus Kapabacteria bacterium]|nr:hypothetical protein [Candidatus Kapabacteria bacterium]